MKKKELKQLLGIAEAVNHFLMAEIADLRDEMEELTCYLPEVKDVLFNGPATVTFWEDGTKTVSKTRGGDEFDPMFGLIATILRKLTNNRGHAVDDCEDIIKYLADEIQSFEDIEDMLSISCLVNDILMVLRESAYLWEPQLGPADEEPEEKSEEPIKTAVKSRLDEIETQLDELASEKSERFQEQLRQTIRNLFDEGEL